MNNDIKKILVIRFSSLGDVILTTPLIKTIKQKYPGAEIDFCVKKQFLDVLKNNPYLTNIIEVDNSINFKGLKQLKKLIKLKNYNLIIDAHNNLRSFYLRLFLNSQKLIFRKHSIKKILFTKFKINLLRNLPSIIERYCNILSNSCKDNLPEIYTTDLNREKIDGIFKEHNILAPKKIVCISPSSHHFTKTYPGDYYIKLIKMFNSKEFLFLLTGKGNDRKITDYIKSHTADNVIDLCDKLSITDLAELINRCDLFISGDTGPMHIAEALNKNLIMTAGSSVKEFGFYPQNKNAVVFEDNSLNCRPCSHIGRSECPKGHFKCMNDIKPEEIYKTAVKLLN